MNTREIHLDFFFFIWIIECYRRVILKKKCFKYFVSEECTQIHTRPKNFLCNYLFTLKTTYLYVFECASCQIILPLEMKKSNLSCNNFLAVNRKCKKNCWCYCKHSKWNFYQIWFTVISYFESKDFLFYSRIVFRKYQIEWMLWRGIA